jgi:hypothetical protein
LGYEPVHKPERWGLDLRVAHCCLEHAGQYSGLCSPPTGAPGQPAELVDAEGLDRRRREGIEYPIWSAVHGLAVLAGQGPLRDVPDATRHHLEELTLTFIDEGLA